MALWPKESPLEVSWESGGPSPPLSFPHLSASLDFLPGGWDSTPEDSETEGETGGAAAEPRAEG